jgi:cell division protein FtsB
MSRRRSGRPPVIPDRDDLDAPTARPEPRRGGLRRAGRVLGFLGGSAAVLGVLAFGVFPTQTFLDQRSATSEAEQRLGVLRDQNEAYEERIERLETSEEIERLAREQYNLVFPGEEAYAVLPAPIPPLELPEVWPFGPMLPADGATTPESPTP